jgi:hypothetical protein
MAKELTWDDIKSKESGTILHDEFKDGLRFIIMRGPAALCAYLGIPQDHPLANHDYDDLPIDCHGGLTFSGGGDKWRPKDFWWYGWDYSHAGDYSFYEDEYSFPISREGKKWLIKDVIDDSWSAFDDMKRLMKLAEKIKEQP